MKKDQIKELIEQANIIHNKKHSTADYINIPVEQLQYLADVWNTSFDELVSMIECGLNI